MFYLHKVNIPMWGPVLKNLLQQIRWCNWNLIWTFGLALITLFSWLNGICMRADVDEVGVGQHGSIRPRVSSASAKKFGALGGRPAGPMFRSDGRNPL